MPDTERAAMQPRAEIEAAQIRLRGELEQIRARGYHGEAYTRGQLAAVAWVLGEETGSPLSGQAGMDVSDPRVVDSEWALSERMLTQAIPMDRRGRNYVIGVEHALMWVLHETNTPL